MTTPDSPTRAGGPTDRQSDVRPGDEAGNPGDDGGDPLAGYSTAAFERVVAAALGDHEFALCLTHDVDRPYKRHQALFYALRERPLYHLRTALPWHNPYWQFEALTALEADLGVRSALYFLQEPPVWAHDSLADWLEPERVLQALGRYDVTAPELVEVIRDLDDRGWEVGLHGSIPAHEDRERLASEKAAVESALGHEVLGGRQHYLRLDGLDTWRNQAALGLRYDASLGSSTEYGFEYGYLPQRPFGDGFVVFPLTVMEQALPDPAGSPGRARRACEDLLAEAADNGAVMTALWHPRYLEPAEFPGHRECYRDLVADALDRGAWVGPPGEFYERLVRAVERVPRPE